jgi:hypothetical protein
MLEPLGGIANGGAEFLLLQPADGAKELVVNVDTSGKAKALARLIRIR